MKPTIPLLLAISLTACARAMREEAPPVAEATEQHGWLQRYVGEWDVTWETRMEPDAEPTTMASVERVRSIGPLWIVDEARAEAETDGVDFRSMLTLGYDPHREVFVGTWIDSVTPHLWTFEGRLDEAREVLTLVTEGPRWGVLGTTAEYRERHEFLDADHRTTASSIRIEDGTWFTFLRTDCRRRE